MERNFKYLKGRKFYLSSRKKDVKETYPKLIRILYVNKSDNVMVSYIEDYGGYNSDKKSFVISEEDLFKYYTALTPKGVATIQFCEDKFTNEKGIFLILNKYIKEDYEPEDIKDTDIAIISLSKILKKSIAEKFDIDEIESDNRFVTPLSIFEQYQMMPISSLIGTDRFNLNGSIPNIIYDPEEEVNIMYTDTVYLYYEDNAGSLGRLLEIDNIKAKMHCDIPESYGLDNNRIEISFSDIYNSLDSSFINGNLASILNCFPMPGISNYKEFEKLYGDLIIGDYKNKGEELEAKYNSIINLLYILTYTTKGDPVFLSNEDIDYKLQYIELNKMGFKKYDYDHISVIRNNDPKYKIVLVKFDNKEIAILKLKVVKDIDQMKIGNSETDVMSAEELSKFMNL